MHIARIIHKLFHENFPPPLPNSPVASDSNFEEDRFGYEEDDCYNIGSDDDDVGEEYDDDSLGSLTVNDVIETAIERIDGER